MQMHTYTVIQADDIFNGSGVQRSDYSKKFKTAAYAVDGDCHYHCQTKVMNI